MDITQITFDQMRALIKQFKRTLPIEQSDLFAKVEATQPGKSHLGWFGVYEEGAPVCALSVMDYETHGYHYLRSAHGPIYFVEQTKELEERCLRALCAYFKKHVVHPAFMRISVLHDLDMCRPTLSTIPYDSTVVIDLSGGDEAILTRMKKRGRRDVRKALRESPVEITDETEAAQKDFSEYYAIMQETGERDGFSPATEDFYREFLCMLGKDHARLFAGRDPETHELLNWSIDTVYDGHAVHYFAAMKTKAMRDLVSDKLVYSLCCTLGSEGVAEIDLMGIGSEFSPKLNGLNTFKCKFAEDITRVSPDRDVPIQKIFYSTLVLAKKLMKR